MTQKTVNLVEHVQPKPVDLQQPTPGVLVLQWLTYAFWGWTLIALAILTFMVIYYLLDQREFGDGLLYAVTASVILLPMSLICDFFYRKHETIKKQGASVILMIIHAVIFALLGIGSLIFSLFSLVTISIRAEVDSSSLATSISLLIIAALYGLTFLRTLSPFPRSNIFNRIYSIILLVIAGTFITVALAGPFAQTFRSKTDRLIDNNLRYIESAISTYAYANSELPKSLSDIDVDGNDGAEQLIQSELVTLKLHTPDEKTGDLRYQLCTTYVYPSTKHKPGARSTARDEYTSFLRTSDHPAGDVCYKLSTYITSKP